jgi:RNA polymerase sigma-70 factor (ECF subfamily)
MTLGVCADFRDGLLANIPRMRGYARALCRQQHLADDLVQEALLRAWECRAQLRDIASMKAWLFTILRNVYFETRVRSRFEVEDVDGVYALKLKSPANQSENIDVENILKALDTLPAQFREALLLVCVEGLSYAVAAGICGCNLGTVKSRVNRGRSALLKVIGSDQPNSVETLLEAAA